MPTLIQAVPPEIEGLEVNFGSHSPLVNHLQGVASRVYRMLTNKDFTS